MPTALDIAFWIGLLVSLAKLSDFILDSAQQLRFQKFMNRLAERLIDLNVVKWYPRLREYKLNIPIFIFVFGVEWFMLWRLLSHNDKFMESTHAIHADGWRSHLTLASWQFIMYLLIVNVLARLRRAWTFCVSTVVPIIIAIPFIILSSFAFLGWAVFVSNIHKTDPQSLNPQTFMIVFWAVLGLVAAAVLWFWLSLVLSGMGIVLGVVWLFVSVLRELFWRIVTHAKGAWTAVWLLITGVLGVVELFIHFKRS